MQELTLKPDAFAYRGKAVATMPSGKRCFIRGGAPGDTLLCAVAKEKKNRRQNFLPPVLLKSYLK